MADNAIIHRIIQDALDRHSNNPENNRPPTNVIERLNYAQSWVWGQRINGRCDENWAIAEHYLYSRYYVAAGRPELFQFVLSLGYNAFKAILGNRRNIVNENNHCNASPPSTAAVNWAARGAADGSNDRQSINHTNRLFAPERPDLPL